MNGEIFIARQIKGRICEYNVLSKFFGGNSLNTSNIGNGINVHTIQTDKFKTSIFCVLIRRPLTRGEATVNALLPSILRRGSKNFCTLSAINAEMERLYGGMFNSLVIKKGEQQIIQFYLETVNIDDETFIDGLKLVDDVIERPLGGVKGFNAEYFESERENLRREIEGRVNNKKEYAKLRCIEEMCKNEPFGVYGDGYFDELQKLDVAGTYEHYRNVLKTSPIDFVYIGEKDEGYINEAVKNIFGGLLQGRDGVIEIPAATKVYEPREKVVVDEKSGSTQAKVCVGIRCNADNKGDSFFALQLACELLGGGASSKLFLNVRERENLCYYVSSFIYRFKSILMVQTGIEADKLGRFMELLELEINNIKDGNISDEELCNAKASLIKRFKGIQDYPSYLVDFYAGQFLISDDDTLERVVQRIEEVDKGSLQSAFEQIYIDTQYMLA